LADDQAEAALTYLRLLTTDREATAMSRLARRMGPAMMGGRDFMTRPALSAMSLAAAQGVRPIANIEALKTDLWPTDPDDDPDLFSRTLRRWRRDEGHA